MSFSTFQFTEPKLYCADGDTIPILEFGGAQHLSWFRGYRMQVSMSPEGVGDHGSSTATMASDLRLLDNLEIPEETKMKYKKLIFLSHVLEASMRYGDFIKWLKTYPALFNEFAVQTANEDSNLEFEDFDLKSLTDLIEVTKDIHVVNEAGVALTISGGPKDNRLISSAVSIGADYIAIQSFKDNSWHALRMGDLFKEGDSYGEQADYFGYEWKEIMGRMIFVVAFSANIEFNHYYSRNYDPSSEEVPQSAFDFEYELIGDGKAINSILGRIHKEKQEELIEKRKAEQTGSLGISTDPLL